MPLWRAQDADDSAPEDLRARVSALITEKTKGWTRQPLTRANLPVVIAVAVLVTAPSVFTLVFGVRSHYLVAMMMGGLFVVVIPLGWRAVQRGMAIAVRATLLAEGHCASCGYSMRGLAADADGCSVCPECGAAWKLAPEAREARPPADDLAAPATPRAPGADPNDIAQDRATRRQMRDFLTRIRVRRNFAALDASGRIVSLASPDPFARPPRAWGSLTRSQQQQLRSRWRRLGLVRRIAFGVLVLPFVVMLLSEYLTRPPPSPLGNPVMFLGTIALMVFWPTFYILFVFRPRVKSGQTLVDTMLQAGHCPSCAASLAGLPVDPRGVTSCSFCRASWDMRKVVPGDGPAGDLPPPRTDGSEARHALART